MKFQLICSALCATLGLFCGCAKGQEQGQAGNYEDLTAAQFKEKMKDPGIVILDVRTPQETAAGKIKGAKEIDFLAGNFEEKINGLDKDKTYLVYCRSGNRSGSAGKIMSKNGFKQVYNLKGGYMGWQAAGYK